MTISHPIVIFSKQHLVAIGVDLGVFAEEEGWKYILDVNYTIGDRPVDDVNQSLEISNRICKKMALTTTGLAAIIARKTNELEN